jgi:hypothetical protein
LLVVKFTALSVKLAHNGRLIENTLVEIYQVNTPPVRFGIIDSEGLRLYAKSVLGTGNVKLFKIAVAIEKLFMIRDAIVFGPDV